MPNKSFIKYPGGEIAFWTILWILAGSIVAYTTFAAGKTGLGLIFATLPVACVLIWLDVRPAKWLVVTYLFIAMIAAVMMMFLQGFTWSLLIRGGLAAYTAFLFATWNGNPSLDSQSIN